MSLISETSSGSLVHPQKKNNYSLNPRMHTVGNTLFHKKYSYMTFNQLECLITFLDLIIVIDFRILTSSKATFREFSGSYSLFPSYTVWQLSIFHNFQCSWGTWCSDNSISIFYLPEEQIFKEAKQLIIAWGKILTRQTESDERGEGLLISQVCFVQGKLGPKNSSVGFLSPADKLYFLIEKLYI